MKRIVVITLLVICSRTLLAQKQGQALVDSLEQSIASHPDDTVKVRLYIQLIRALDGVQPRKGFPYGEKGLALAQQLSYQPGIADINNGLGLLVGDTGNNAHARDYFEKSLAINKRLDSKINIIANLNNIGRSYERESNFSKASEYYFKALAQAQESGNNERAALVGTNILAMYVEEQDYQKAMAYGDSTIKWGTAAQALIHVAKAYEMEGVIYLQTQDTPRARRNYDTALTIYKRLGNQIAMVSALSNLATLEADPQKQIDIIRRAQAILDTIAPLSQNSLMNQTNLGLEYLTLGESKKGSEQVRNFTSAAAWLKRADSLSKVTDMISYEAPIEQGLSDLEKDRGNYREALLHFKRYTTINDSIFSQDSKNEIAKLESQRSIDLKNKEIENGGLQIANQRKTMLLLIVGVALLGAIGVILWRQGVVRKKTNDELIRLNTELSEANKVKAKFLGILSHDLRSPIARLLNFLQLQKMKPDRLSAAEQSEYWEKLTGSSEALLDTMEAMLLWSKGQMEYFKPRVTPVAVEELLERLQRFFSDVPGILMEFTCEKNLSIETDGNYLWTIMQNLTAYAVRALEFANPALEDTNTFPEIADHALDGCNAVLEAATAGNPAPRIRWKAWRTGDDVYCQINDNGPGVSDEQLRALYDETVGTAARQGLGMHIIRDLAKAINCRITINPRSAEGAEFLLQLHSRIPE